MREGGGFLPVRGQMREGRGQRTPLDPSSSLPSAGLPSTVLGVDRINRAASFAEASEPKGDQEGGRIAPTFHSRGPFDVAQDKRLCHILLQETQVGNPPEAGKPTLRAPRSQGRLRCDRAPRANPERDPSLGRQEPPSIGMTESGGQFAIPTATMGTGTREQRLRTAAELGGPFGKLRAGGSQSPGAIAPCAH